MSNDVIIRVRVRQDAREGFAALAGEAEAAGQRSAEKFTARFGVIVGRMGVLLRPQLQAAGTKMGEEMGEHSGRSFTSRFSQHLGGQANRLVDLGRTIGQRVADGARERLGTIGSILRGGGGNTTSGSRSGGMDDDRGRGGAGGAGGPGGDAGKVEVDIDRQSLLSRLLGWGRDAATRFWEGFSDRLSNFFSGDLLSLFVKGFAVAAIAPLIAAPLGAAITTAVGLALGGGVIAAGVVSAFKDPRIQAGATELKEKLAKVFEDFGKPFRGPVQDFLENFTGNFLPQLSGFASRMSEAFAPLAGDIGNGLIGMLQNMLPGIEEGLIGIQPIIRELAESLPSIGQAIGDFFRIIGSQGDDAAVFFNDLLAVMASTIRVTARIIAAFTSMYANIRNAVAGITSSWRRGASLWGNLVGDFAEYAIGIYLRILRSIQNVTGRMSSAFRTTFNAIRAAANVMGNAITRIINTIRSAINAISFNGLIGRAQAAASRAGGFFSQFFANGGVVGQAASGGIRNNMTWVGERGPELVNLAPGSRVWSNGDSMRMSGGQGGGGGGIVEARWVGAESGLTREIMNSIQLRVIREFQGSTDKAMGLG